MTPPSGAPPAPASPALRVVTFNIRNGRALDGRNLWWCRRRRVVESLTRLDADLVALQEVYRFQARWLLPRLGAYASYGVGRSDGGRRGEHALVLYRRDRFDALRSTTRWFGPSPEVPGSGWQGADFPRTASIVTLRDRHDGERLVFACTHLHARNGEHRVASAEQLGAWVTDTSEPVIVAGDLNDDPAGPVLAALEARGLRSAVPADAGGSNHDFTGRVDGRRIDHVLVGPGWTVAAGWVDQRRVRGKLASDHWPVGADLIRRATAVS